MPFTLYDANLFVANATPTDQSPVAIRQSPLTAVYALRITLYDTNLFVAYAPSTLTNHSKHLEVREFGVSFIAKALDDLDCRCRVRSVCYCHLC